MAENKLKSCPFCGCSDKRVGIRKMGKKGYRIVCTRCGVMGPFVSVLEFTGNQKLKAQEQAKVIWNQREGIRQDIIATTNQLYETDIANQEDWERGYHYALDQILLKTC